MGFAGISPGSLILIFCIALLVFGPARLKTLGTDLADIIKQFKKALEDDKPSA